MRTNYYRLVAICLLALFALGLVEPFEGLMPKVEVAKAEPAKYSENAIWIMNAAWSGFPSDKKNVLTQHLNDVVADLQDSSIIYVFVFVGYWNPTDSTIGYTMTDSQIKNVINALHSINRTVLAWAEDNGAVDVTPTNRDKLYTEISKCMGKGFDGYNDDIENYVGTLQDWIDYQNNATVVLHNLGKLMTADVPYDWQQNMNPYLRMDYIVTMFYSNKSTFEDPQARAYWQENFGEYQGNNTPPASPVILGIMNYHGNSHPLSWQLDWIDNELSSGDGHPQLVGFSIWLYEYMSDTDWKTWNNWLTTPISTPTSGPIPTPPSPSTPELGYYTVVGLAVLVTIMVLLILVILRKVNPHKNSLTRRAQIVKGYAWSSNLRD